MKEKIEKYMEGLFEKAPVNRKVIELKEELKINALERYEDLKQEGMSEEDAYKLVINSVGDIKSLLANIEMEEEKEKVMPVPDKKYALLKAIAVALYIFTGVIFLLAQNYMNNSIEAIAVTLIVLIVPICISVYIANMKPKYIKQDATVVEAFREWQTEKQNKKAIRGAVSVIIWSLTVIAYFLISFLTDAWHITWLIYLVGVCFEAIVSLIFSIRKGE